MLLSVSEAELSVGAAGFFEGPGSCAVIAGFAAGGAVGCVACSSACDAIVSLEFLLNRMRGRSCDVEQWSISYLVQHNNY